MGPLFFQVLPWMSSCLFSALMTEPAAAQPAGAAGAGGCHV
ncbi:hypothetical protein L510_4442 [Bordetella bronchiseptica MBORD591]|nr:hypothetical protein L510_4442 [Bordetella bronchiseptica MBORD591]